MQSAVRASLGLIAQSIGSVRAILKDAHRRFVPGMRGALTPALALSTAFWRVVLALLRRRRTLLAERSLERMTLMEAG